jgi:hypothetical protein
LLLVVENLGTPGQTGELVRGLVQRPALAVEPPPPPRPATNAVRIPSRTFQLDVAQRITPIATSHYAASAIARPTSVGLAQLLRPVPLMTLQPFVLSRRRSVHVEGNQVIAMGPALLLLANGVDVISTAVVGNELRSTRPTGAVYVRHTDATVFTGNHCECIESVNVVVLRPDSAPVTATGNVILGAQPVAQRDPVVLEKRAAVKSLVKMQVAREIAAATPVKAAPIAMGMAMAPSRAAAMPALNLGNFSIFSNLSIGGVSFPTFPTFPGPIISLPGTPITPQPTPNKPAPDPRNHSLVVVGGTRVVAAGNATSSGALTLDADQQSELNT